jgi:DNA-binding transcriptional MerR regulator
MSFYKISDLENLSGIKSHTIRIWEQRYGMLEPLRTDTNIRYYDDNQLRKLLNVVSLINAGNKISAVAKLTVEEIEHRIESISNSNDIGLKEGIFINQLITAGLSYNESEFNKHYKETVETFGFIEAYGKVIYPMLQKIGYLWRSDDLNPAQEHFVSTLLKQKVYTAIDNLKVKKTKNTKWLLFMPEHDHHDLGLLISSYVLKSVGMNVTFLGADVPFDNLKQAYDVLNPSHLLLFVVARHKKGSIEELQKNLSQHMKGAQSVICCTDETAKALPTILNQLVITSYSDFLDLINSK